MPCGASSCAPRAAAGAVVARRGQHAAQAAVGDLAVAVLAQQAHARQHAGEQRRGDVADQEGARRRQRERRRHAELEREQRQAGARHRQELRAVRQVRARAVVDHLHAHAAADQPADVVQRDVTAVSRVVKAAIGVFADDAGFRHAHWPALVKVALPVLCAAKGACATVRPALIHVR